ncbi:MAG: rubrerythrin family protein [Calditrichaeota bacterium]|nr:rubrerythrin family protein [Calditrichota bacterium]
MKKMTEKSLSEAFAGESMAHMKYTIFAEVARKDGYPNIAKLFEAIAYAEFVHAKNHAKNLGYVKGTIENLQTGIDGENFEVEEMYPAYDAIAKLQGEKDAERSIRYAVEAEKIHSKFYQDAKESAKKDKDMDVQSVYVCPICGYTHIDDDVPDNCPVCGVSSDKFVKF